MAKGVEFTNVRIFERETRRMPNFALHELAHAYHDQVLPAGFDNADIKAAYERAKAGGWYDRVERRFGDGRTAEEARLRLDQSARIFCRMQRSLLFDQRLLPLHPRSVGPARPRNVPSCWANFGRVPPIHDEPRPA